MADAADSKSVGRKAVKVRLLSPAPTFSLAQSLPSGSHFLKPLPEAERRAPRLRKCMEYPPALQQVV